MTILRDYRGWTIIAVLGHYDCAGNPIEEREQKRQIVSATERLQAWNLDVEIIGLWVDEQWQVVRLS